MARRPSPSPYIRSLLQSLFFKEMKILGTMSVKQVLFDDVRELCNPVELLLDPRNELVEVPHDPRFDIVKRTNWFVERAGRVCHHYIILLCMTLLICSLSVVVS